MRSRGSNLSLQLASEVGTWRQLSPRTEPLICGIRCYLWVDNVRKSWILGHQQGVRELLVGVGNPHTHIGNLGPQIPQLSQASTLKIISMEIDQTNKVKLNGNWWKGKVHLHMPKMEKSSLGKAALVLRSLGKFGWPESQWEPSMGSFVIKRWMTSVSDRALWPQQQKQILADLQSKSIY